MPRNGTPAALRLVALESVEREKRKRNAANSTKQERVMKSTKFFVAVLVFVAAVPMFGQSASSTLSAQKLPKAPTLSRAPDCSV